MFYLPLALLAFLVIGLSVVGIRTVLDPGHFDFFNHIGLPRAAVMAWAVYTVVGALLMVHPRTLFVGCIMLLLNNMFGGIALQTSVLAIADATAAKVAITAYPRKPTPILEGALLVLLLAILHAIVLMGDQQLLRHVGMGSIILALLYVLSIVFVRRIDSRTIWEPTHVPVSPETAHCSPNLFGGDLLSTR